MLRQADGDSRNDRLVLGFDAGCMSCSNLAESIEEAVGAKLEAMSLSDPQVKEWRRRALGEDPPWAPTLIELKNGQVKAWTGAMMGAHLARKLGPSVTWKVAKVLGESTHSNRTEHHSLSGLSRSQFLKGLGGAAVGLTVLSGTGGLATPAAAAEDEHWLSQLSITSSKELSEKQAVVTWARLTRGRHLRRLLLSQVMEERPSAKRIRSRMLSAKKTGVTTLPTTTVKGIHHQLKGGGRLIALAYQEDDTLILLYRLDKLGQNTKLFSRVIEEESKDTFRVLGEAEDNDVIVAAQATDSDEEVYTITARRRCRSSRQCRGACYVCRCVSYRKVCAINCCGPCAFACRTGWSCLACLGIWCPVCVSLNRCCRYKECRWRQSCS